MSRKSGVIMSFILMFFEVISTLLITPLIIKSLGQAEYGVYKLSFSIISYLVLLDLGIGNSIVRYMSKYHVKDEKKNSRRFLGVVTIYYIIIACLAFLIGLILVYYFPSIFSKGLNSNEIILGQKLLFVTIINTAITLLTAPYPYIIIAYEKFVFSKTCSIFKVIIRVILNLIVLNIGMRSLSLVLINLLVTIIERLVSIFYVIFKLKIKPEFKNLDFSFIKSIATYSSFIFLQMLATQINSMADQLLLGILVSSSAIIIGIYGIGAQISQYFQQIGSAFTNVLMPGVVRMVEKDAKSETICTEMIKIGRIIFMSLLLVWIGFLCYGEKFIYFWVGKEYSEAFAVSILLMTAYLFIYTESIGTQILWALNKHKEQSIIKISIVILNIILTIFLIKWKPILGAAIGTFISLLLGDIITMNIVFRKKIGISLKDYYSGLFKGIAIVGIITTSISLILSKYFANNFMLMIISIIATGIIYVTLIYLIGMNENEKEMIAKILSKFIKMNK